MPSQNNRWFDFQYLVYAQLPFAEDEHLYKFPSLADMKPTDEQNEAVDDLIDSMDLDASDTLVPSFLS